MSNVIDINRGHQTAWAQAVKDGTYPSFYDDRFEAVADLTNFLEGEAETKDRRMIAARLFEAIAYGRIRWLGWCSGEWTL